MIAIIAAMEVEMELLKSSMQIKEEQTISGSTYYIGDFCGKNIVLVRCGVGKVNAAMATQTLVLNFKPDLIINLGVAGGIGENIKIGDIVLASSCVQHDADVTALENSPIGTIFTGKGDIINFPCSEKYNKIFFETAQKTHKGTVHMGVVASGDQFIADKEKCDFFKTNFSASACEMEIGAIAQVCYLNDTELVSIKAISDNANDDGKVDFMSFVTETAHSNSNCLKEIFKNL